MGALGAFPEGGTFSVADLSTLLCLAATVVSYITLGRRRCLPGRLVLILLASGCVAYEMLDDVYDEIASATMSFPYYLETFDYAWTWFEAFAASVLGALVVLSHAVAAQDHYDRRCAASSPVPMPETIARRRAVAFARRAGWLFLLMAAVEFVVSVLEMCRIL
jgi:hypothetical protein